MARLRRRHQGETERPITKAGRGFTLIELMVVVAIAGILATLTVYEVRKYLVHSRTTEAKNAVGRMAKDATAAYERETIAPALLPPGSAATGMHMLCDTAWRTRAG